MNPMPKRMTKLYGILAVIMVIIPEWIAETTLLIFQFKNYREIPKESIKWSQMPELKLASMNLRDLRILARQLKVFGYSSDTRSKLTKRLMKALNKHK